MELGSGSGTSRDAGIGAARPGQDCLIATEAVTDRLHAGGSADDRLSALPDDLLHRVLSFLPCERAVQTTVLSKRWTGLWRSAPGINIDMTRIKIANRFSTTQRWEKMADFVTNLLMFHNAPRLESFRIAIDDYISADRLPAINTWVRRGIMCRPSVLEIEIYEDMCTPPSMLDIFDHARPRLFHLPSIQSPRLKTLSLVSVSIGSSFAEQIRSGCPVLEDLYLEDCCTEFNDIQSGTLKQLSLINCYRHSVVDATLAIRAPALATLKLDPRLNTPEHDEKNEVSVDGSTNSLFNAWVAFPPDMPRTSRVMLLASLSNVTKLELTACFSAELMLDNELGQFPIFSNLRTLSLEGCIFGNCDAIGKCKTLDMFLQKAPNLEKLTLEHHWPCCKSTFQCGRKKKNKIKANDRTLHSPDQKAFGCLNLKLIEIKYDENYMDDQHEQQLFQVMRGLWKNLPKATFTFSKI